MNTSAILKAEFNNDGSGQYLYHFSGDISSPILPIGSKPLDSSDVTVATLLGAFFGSNSYAQTQLEYMMPSRRRTGAPTNPQRVLPADSIGMGGYMSSSNNVSHSNTVSLFCFNEASLRAALSESIIRNEAPDVYERMQTIPIEQIPQLLVELNPENAGVFNIVKDPKLTITRVTSAEMELVAAQYLDVTPFFDAFDLVKDRVTRQEQFLNGTGYAPAVYTDNGLDGSNDTIVFTGGYAMTTTFPQVAPFPQPTPIILT